MTISITIRLPDRDAEALDELIASGRYADRTTAVRTAISRLLRAERERDIVAVFRRGYGQQPVSDDEQAPLTEAADEMFERLRDEESGQP
jgi:Arc/MetJ-type ribon-helix-helix transcriptional regulator